jgi:hypothetical protein
MTARRSGEVVKDADAAEAQGSERGAERLGVDRRETWRLGEVGQVQQVADAERWARRRRLREGVS